MSSMLVQRPSGSRFFKNGQPLWNRTMRKPLGSNPIWHDFWGISADPSVLPETSTARQLPPPWARAADPWSRSGTVSASLSIPFATEAFPLLELEAASPSPAPEVKTPWPFTILDEPVPLHRRRTIDWRRPSLDDLFWTDTSKESEILQLKKDAVASLVKSEDTPTPSPAISASISADSGNVTTASADSSNRTVNARADTPTSADASNQTHNIDTAVAMTPGSPADSAIALPTLDLSPTARAFVPSPPHQANAMNTNALYPLFVGLPAPLHQPSETDAAIEGWQAFLAGKDDGEWLTFSAGSIRHPPLPEGSSMDVATWRQTFNELYVSTEGRCARETGRPKRKFRDLCIGYCSFRDTFPSARQMLAMKESQQQQQQLQEQLQQQEQLEQDFYLYQKQLLQQFAPVH